MLELHPCLLRPSHERHGVALLASTAARAALSDPFVYQHERPPATPIRSTRGDASKSSAEHGGQHALERKAFFAFWTGKMRLWVGASMRRARLLLV